jgi:hypothetical protein
VREVVVVPKKASKKGGEGTDKESELAKLTKLVESLIFSDDFYINMAIYAILEVPQELYFGMVSEKNINLLETVTLSIDIHENGNIVRNEVRKPYFSPTKQRGVERRAIAYSLVKTSDNKYIPYYKYFNLSIDVTNTYQDGKPDPRDILTYLWGATWTKPVAYLRGRIQYGGGVAIQPLLERKQRNRVEYNMYNMLKSEEESEREKSKEVAQMIWTKEYVEPYTLIPIVRYGTLLGVNNMEPHAMAYAFLEGLKLAGAGTPKGISILEDFWLSGERKEKVLAVDVGVNLLDDPVIIPPAIPSPMDAINEFKEKAKASKNIFDESNPDEVFSKIKSGKVYLRIVGDNAYEFLKTLASKFVSEYLMRIDSLDIPRVRKAKELGGSAEAGKS